MHTYNVCVCGFVFCNLIYVRIVEWILHYACINWDRDDERMFAWTFFYVCLGAFDVYLLYRSDRIDPFIGTYDEG